MSDELKPLVGSIEPMPTPEPVIAEEVVEEIVDAVNEIPKPVEPKPLPTRVTVPVAVDIESVKDTLPAPAGPAVVGNDSVDDVRLSACVYKNINSQKSLTVHHLQRRLLELGFVEAGLDKDGYFGAATKAAIRNFQSSKKLDVTGDVDAVTFKAVFKGDPNVRVIL
jgi:hypothetical protein